MRSRCDSTLPSLHISRCVTSAFDISSVNSPTGMPLRTPRFAAMQSASADFPIDGRAATITRFPGWKPEVMPVEVAEAGRRAGDLDARTRTAP